MDEHAPERSTVDALGIRPPSAYAVESCTTPAGDVVLTFAGELDLAAAPVVREQLEAAAATGARRVVLDMTAVTFVDSSALRELLRADGALRRAGGVLVLAAVPAGGRAPARADADRRRARVRADGRGRAQAALRPAPRSASRARVCSALALAHSRE